ncbi:unnamed protein product [Caenorhabditis auriculariae]|uniref:Uncharacterized protein n=1 Tax=Caenorhabditis auriculariae TaxID=2777116 RepID=A0A8S1HU53_9PELO|nr:unnamed protein product [Caenorhabditis auriculariae]
MLLLLAIALKVDAQTCCPTNGIWAEWTLDRSKCVDNCGGCGTLTKTRVCASEPACPCTGPKTSVGYCDTAPCMFPRNTTCCPGLQLGVYNSVFACGPPMATDVPEVPRTTCKTTTCASKGIWSEWRSSGSCSATCGSCGTVSRTRTCLSDPNGCPCTGETSSTVPCGAAPCAAGQTCCDGFVPAPNPASGVLECVSLTPIPDPVFETIPATACEPLGNGLWNPWSKWSTCSATCGMLGTRIKTRTCASLPYGCPCIGSPFVVEPCGNVACSGATPCSPQSFLTTSFDGAVICVLQAVPVVAGQWTDWMPLAGFSCNDTCGGCGRVRGFRYCDPPGSTCSGSYFSDSAPCGSGVCSFPRTSCCGTWIKRFNSVSRTFFCGDPTIPLPTLPPTPTLPTVTIPVTLAGITVPTISDVSLPTITLPGVTLPTLPTGDITLPTLPTISLPTVTLPAGC